MGEAIEPAFSDLYAAFEWLRDGASPFDAMTACRLQSPNWWRTAQDALAVARALLDDRPPEPSRGTDGSQMNANVDDPVWRVAAAIRWAFEAAVALRLPYGTFQPAAAWTMGRRGACLDMASASGGGMLATCRAVLAGAGARCLCDGLTSEQLVAALDHAERTRAVCYTERQNLL